MNQITVSQEERDSLCRAMATELPAIRRRININQSQFAEIMGVARTTISQIESKRNMTWTNYLAVVFSLALFVDERAKEYIYNMKLLPKAFTQNSVISFDMHEEDNRR